MRVSEDLSLIQNKYDGEKNGRKSFFHHLPQDKITEETQSRLMKVYCRFPTQGDFLLVSESSITSSRSITFRLLADGRQYH